MPDHRDIQRFGFFEKRQMFRILWIKVLVDRCDLQSAKPKCPRRCRQVDPHNLRRLDRPNTSRQSDLNAG